MRDETTMVAKFLPKQGLDAEPLSSDLSQADRERVMGRMKQHNLRFLCATDVAARGIDISNLSHVINYSVPESPEVYVHRTGRTGRAGKTACLSSLPRAGRLYSQMPTSQTGAPLPAPLPRSVKQGGSRRSTIADAKLGDRQVSER